MDKIILDSIPFTVDRPQLLHMVHLDEKSPEADDVLALARQAEAIARPKAMYKIAYVYGKGDHYVTIDDTIFTSRVLRVNLDKAQRVFAYVATAGMELEQWANAKSDILEKYWADAIMLMAVRSAVSFLNNHIQDRYRPGTLSRMNPGSLPDWPLKEQGPLFSLLGNVEQSIGVRLTPSFLMIPRKSVSGIQFPVEENFESCQLCERPDCPSRRAPFDPTLFDRRYRSSSS